MCRHDRLEVANSAGFVASLSKPATVPGTSGRPRASWQIRVPNIMGTLAASWLSGTGAFKKTGDGNCSDGQIWGSDKADFSASRSSAIYSSSSTVQPAAVRSLFCIKS